MRVFLRKSIQLLIAVTLIYLFLRQDYSNAGQPFFAWSGWLDPLMGLAGLLQMQWPLLAILSFVMILLAIFGGRFFCGWICPIGAILDLTDWFQKITGWHKFYTRHSLNLSLKIKQSLNLLRWIICGMVFGFIVINYLVVLAFNPLVILPREVYRIINELVPWTLIGLIFLGFAAFPRFWCRFICPAGSILNFANRFLKCKTRFDESLCRKCGLCQKNCPILNIYEKFQFGNDCLHCGDCRKFCPTSAIKTGSRFSHTQKQTLDLSPAINEGRRDFLVSSGVGLGIILLGLASRNQTTNVSSVKTHWDRLLRPPGTLNEAGLAKTCTRCGQCLVVCPTKVLVPAGLEAGLPGLGTPRFIPRRGKCMFCMACGQVCPTKAIIPVQPGLIRLGTAKINPQSCLAWSKGTKCLLCVETCSSFAISIDKDNHPVIDLRKCIGCGACEANCPVEGSAVILSNAGEIRRI